MYLSAGERKLVKKALNQDVKDDFFESEDFQDFLELFKCRSKVMKENVQTIIFEIAQQELIQKPHIMASAWQKELNLLKSMDAFSTPTKILSMIYEKTLPTAKKVITLFEYDCKNDNERDCIAFLKRYVKGLDVSLLKKFLIFCTGSDIINVSKIEITFTMPESEYARQPVAHTCGPVLELPCTYRNFPELRSEFSNILKCSYWEMDIV